MADKIDSTSAERTLNNVMRHEYRVLTDDEKEQMKAIKDLGLAFIEACNDIALGSDVPLAEKPGLSRAMALAKTKMEEAVMWAVKGLTK